MGDNAKNDENRRLEYYNTIVEEHARTSGESKSNIERMRELVKQLDIIETEEEDKLKYIIKQIKNSINSVKRKTSNLSESDKKIEQYEFTCSTILNLISQIKID